MGTQGIGIDLVEVARITAAMEKHGAPWLEKIFTESERAYCDKQHEPAIHYAARFAAKEAAAKALGTGIGKHAGLRDLEVSHDDNGAPKLLLHGAAKAFAKERGIGHVLISLTHTKDHAAANAVAVS
ncbi:MAG: holo-ACP synthase [Akkermansiaceae bacterium]|nr:holo-ACP synthase [Akkermansiaceae bacterium]